jgi:hypothetical protein
MASNLQAVAQLLQATLDPQQHKQGTIAVKHIFRIKSANTRKLRLLSKLRRRTPDFLYSCLISLLPNLSPQILDFLALYALRTSSSGTGL